MLWRLELTSVFVGGVLGFAEHVRTNAARLWAELGIDGKRELQEALVPDGLSSGTGVGDGLIPGR